MFDIFNVLLFLLCIVVFYYTIEILKKENITLEDINEYDSFMF